MMKIFSFLGTEYFFLLLIPFLCWCVDSRLGIRAGFILLVSVGISETMKLTFHWPRPYWYSTSIKKIVIESSFGFPSGHSLSAIVVWGVLAAGLRKWWGWLIAGMLIFFIGFSRLYLGVHFPHDVLIGWLIGGLMLWLIVRYWELVADWAKKLNPWQQVLSALLVGLGIILIQAVPYFWLKWTEWQPPQSWTQFMTEAISMKRAFTSGGTLFGLLVGPIWLEHHGGFNTSGTWWQLLLRYTLGLIGMLVVYIGLDILFGLIAAKTEDILPFILRFVRYTLIGLWISVAAPWMFVKFHLAEKKI